MFSQANSWVTCEAIFFFVRDSFKTPYGHYSINLHIIMIVKSVKFTRVLRARQIS